MELFRKISGEISKIDIRLEPKQYSHLYVESKNEAGSTFIVELPLPEAQEAV